MPQIKVDRIVSFTSEDPGYAAANILSTDSSKKWKCKTAGEKSASVVLQLDQPYIINAIDIGNENSAYVEVLVSRSSSPEDYKVLLVMSAFMTPLEARQSQNIGKVRMFKQDDLSEPERHEKWDRVKIVCTQPFNRHVQYGLSFIRLHSSDGKNAEKPHQTAIGKFIIRPASPDNFSAGSLFARKKLQENSGEQSLKGAAAIREATSLAHIGSPLPKQKIRLNLPSTPNNSLHNKDTTSTNGSNTPKEKKERTRNEILYSKDEEDRHYKIDKIIEKKAKEKADSDKEQDKLKQIAKQKDTPSKHSEKKTDKKTDHKHEKIKQSQKNAPSTPSDLKPKPKDITPKESLKRKQTEGAAPIVKKLKKEVLQKPFEKLLEDVVLVISGIQNPDRASLRTMALSMGAKYKPDWGDTCTHLICAFANTPKFIQVKGKGKIVTRKWIEDCYNNRKKLPWRRYALDKADRGPESDEEICEKGDTPPPASPSLEPMEMYGINSSDSDDDTRQRGSDTDEKIAEIMKKQEDKEDDIFNVETDEEPVKESSHKNVEFKQKFKDFFEEKSFYVDEHLGREMERKVKQYIAAYNGLLLENLDASIDIIVTNHANYKSFKDIHPFPICVAPDWIWECHNCQKLVPMNDFMFE